MNINLLLLKNVVNQSVTALAYQPEIRLANIVAIVKSKNQKKNSTQTRG